MTIDVEDAALAANSTYMYVIGAHTASGTDWTRFTSNEQVGGDYAGGAMTNTIEPGSKNTSRIDDLGDASNVAVDHPDLLAKAKACMKEVFEEDLTLEDQWQGPSSCCGCEGQAESGGGLGEGRELEKPTLLRPTEIRGLTQARVNIQPQP